VPSREAKPQPDKSEKEPRDINDQDDLENEEKLISLSFTIN